MHNFGYDEEGWKGSLRDHHIWRRIFAYCLAYLPGLGGAVFLSLLVTGATLGLPRIMQLGIDRYITAADLSSAVRIEGLARLGAVYAGLVLVVFLAGFVQVVVLEKTGQSVMHVIRQDLFTHLLDLDLAFFNNQPVGRLVTRMTNDIQNMYEMFTSVMVTLFNDFLKLAGILVVLFFMNYKLALVMSVFVPVSLFITLIFSRLARQKFRAIRTQLAKLNSYLQESISGMNIIQLFNRQDDSRDKYGELSREYYYRTLSQIKLFGTFMPLTELMSSFAIALIVWYGGGEIIRRELTLGELVAFLSYMRLFFQPMRELSQKYSIVQSALASAERIFDLLDTENSLASPPAPVFPDHTQGCIVFENVSFGYETDEPVLQRISLKIEPGETVAVVGSTGAGKSSLINLLIRFYDPQEGRIMLDGIDLRSYALRDLRQRIGIVMQDVVILPDTLLANIVMETGVERQQVEDIINRTGMRKFVDGLPAGLDTPIGEGNLDLSSGEKQLLCFARVLCRNPKVLILDEATASVDSDTENILEQTMAASFENRTSLVIAHRLSTIHRADRILVIDDGRIREQGTHSELMALQGVYFSLVRLDMQGDPENGRLPRNGSPSG